MNLSSENIAVLMAAFRKGAGARLTEVFYPKLKRMAASKLRGERKGHSWQPTLLVNELYLQLVKSRHWRRLNPLVRMIAQRSSRLPGRL